MPVNGAGMLPDDPIKTQPAWNRQTSPTSLLSACACLIVVMSHSPFQSRPVYRAIANLLPTRRLSGLQSLWQRRARAVGETLGLFLCEASGRDVGSASQPLCYDRGVWWWCPF